MHIKGDSMKVYKYYIRRKHIPKIFENNRGNENDWVFYAHTCDKKVKKSFEKNRNMKIFQKIVTKMSKAEYRSFIASAQMECLSEQQYLYFNDKLDENGQRVGKYIEIAVTLSEQDTQESIMDSGLFEEFNYVCPAIFNNKYLRALERLQYVAMYKLWISAMDNKILYCLIDLLREREEEIDMSSYDTPEIDYDEVALFIDLFGSTL